MQIVNELARGTYTDSSTGLLRNPTELESWPDIYYDQNGDGKATALDALRVINDLARNLENGGEGELIHMANAPAEQNSWSEGRVFSRELPEEIHVLDERIRDTKPIEPSLFARNSTVVAEDVIHQSVGKEATDTVDHLLALDDPWWQI